MKTVLKGKKKTSISVKGDKVCWSSFVGYECKNSPESEAQTAAGEAAAHFRSKPYIDNDNISSLNSDTAGTEKTPRKHSTQPPLMMQNTEIQCELDKNKTTEREVDFGDIIEIYHELNSVFIKRSTEVEAKLPNDLELQTKTYEEWCENLIKCSESIFECIEHLKTEFQEFAAIPLSVSKTELKFENDRDNLIRLIQKRFHAGVWRFDELELETLPFKEILNPDSDYLSEVTSSAQRQKRSKAKLRSPFTKPKT